MSTSEPQPAIDDAGVEIPAEHVITPALRRALQQCYDRGKALIAKENPDHDYATSMFAECVTKDPSNLVYVEAFLDNLQAKYKNNKKGARSLGFGGGSRSEFKKALQKKDWRQVLKSGPELLKTNPWDVATLRGMAQACEVYHYNEVELRYLKNALDANPKDVEVNRHCALSLARMGQFDQAIACWHRIEELRPNDQEAPKMVSDLTVEKTRVRAMGLAPTMNTRRAGTSSSAKPQASAPSAGATAAGGASASGAATTSGAVASGSVSSGSAAASGATAAAAPEASNESAQRRREVTLTPIQRLERAIADDPTVAEHYLELADLYVKDDRIADAERTLQRAQQASPGNTDVLEMIEDLSLKKVRRQLKVAERRAAKDKSAANEQLVEQIKQSLQRLELDIAIARSQRYPDDLEAKFKLAQSLKRMGNYREAAEQFHASREAPGRYATARLEMGECLQHLKQYLKALHCYQRSADKAAKQDDTYTQKVALYRAGVLAMGMKEQDAALQALSQLAELDADYKDVAARLDKLRRMSDKS